MESRSGPWHATWSSGAGGGVGTQRVSVPLGSSHTRTCARAHTTPAPNVLRALGREGGGSPTSGGAEIVGHGTTCVGRSAFAGTVLPGPLGVRRVARRGESGGGRAPGRPPAPVSDNRHDGPGCGGQTRRPCEAPAGAPALPRRPRLRRPRLVRRRATDGTGHPCRAGRSL